MRYIAVIMTALMGGTASLAAAQLLPDGDPHLAAIPRSDEERARIDAATAPATSFEVPENFEELPAGAASVLPQEERDAFHKSSGLVTDDRQMRFTLGEALFEKLWVSSPSSTRASDGLGPLYNARSCAACHIRGGRGHPPEGPQDTGVSLLLRISVPASPEAEVPAIEDWIATEPDPVYGHQLQDFATVGQAAEFRLEVTYDERPIALSGDETASLRVPTYHVEDLGYGPLAEGVMFSPRVAPPMIGLGLLEAIPAADILAAADPDDADGDGISGRAAIAWSRELGRPVLGRFGWKAGEATLREQTASAFSNDIGISSPLSREPWGDCTEVQTVCRSAPHGAVEDGLEIEKEPFNAVSYYVANLGVPRRRDLHDPQVLRGKQVFFETGCGACHTPKHVTARLQDRPEASFQLIWPFTDLLLHDMGEGLADGRPEGRATGREWRTPPLWGIGLTQGVSGHTQFLHDGRARSLLEAVLWHGGEAEAQRETVISMPPPDRAALIRFLESL